MILNMVGGGGGGGLSPNSAVIHVTAPAGSTISFVKGSVAAKVLGPDNSHVNSADTSLADWYYSVSSSNYGTWTVTATLGTDTATATVTIDSNKQYDLSMAVKWFIRDGVLVDPLFETFGNATASQGSGVYTIQTTSNNTGGIKSARVDLSRFATIVLDLSSGCQSWNGTGAPAVGYGTGITVLPNDTVAGFTGSTYLNNSIGSITPGKYTVDVSAVNGPYEVACSVAGSTRLSPINGVLNIVNAYLK